MDGKFLREIMSGLKCGACGQHYDTDRANVLGYQYNVWIDIHSYLREFDGDFAKLFNRS